MGIQHMTISLPSRQPEGYGDLTSPFALDDRAFRALGHRLVDTLGTYLEALPENPVYQPLPDEVRQQIEEMRLPAEGIDPEAIMEFFIRRCCHTAAARIIRASPHSSTRPHPS